ncbi:hypothetical protein JQX13_22475 [Archangium violaceum]|uniref:hypothetical protein n=1 Tax=Archangium violaceum TaxID=83451 RepID=UPI00193C3CEE|nr:hypothetical protein [Archangium violaceum]QRK12546.1 hypothetical protein JQX13_22475 [Archangium violaceum]
MRGIEFPAEADILVETPGAARSVRELGPPGAVEESPRVRRQLSTPGNSGTLEIADKRFNPEYKALVSSA